MIDVWLASVTVGNDAIAPCPNATPISMRRATFGASPRATMSYNTFELVPSNKKPITCCGRSPGSSTSSCAIAVLRGEVAAVGDVARSRAVR